MWRTTIILVATTCTIGAFAQDVPLQDRPRIERSEPAFGDDALADRAKAQRRADEIVRRSDVIAERAIQSICRGCLGKPVRARKAPAAPPLVVGSRDPVRVTQSRPVKRIAATWRDTDRRIRRMLLAGLGGG